MFLILETWFARPEAAGLLHQYPPPSLPPPPLSLSLFLSFSLSLYLSLSLSPSLSLSVSLCLSLFLSLSLSLCLSVCLSVCLSLSLSLSLSFLSLSLSLSLFLDLKDYTTIQHHTFCEIICSAKVIKPIGTHFFYRVYGHDREKEKKRILDQ